MAERILMGEFKDLKDQPWLDVDLINDNVFHWKVALVVLNPDSLYHGGYFLAKMKFPANYPYSPPDFKFSNPLFHPNVYPDGRLCISILHPPGEDEMSGESASIRWSPAQRAESVLISVLSLLDDANIDSPANVDASVMYRKDRKKYEKMVAADLDKSKKDIPEGYVMPTAAAYGVQKKEVVDFDDDWADSDVEFDFDDSDEDEDMEVDVEAESEDDDEAEAEHKET